MIPKEKHWLRDYTDNVFGRSGITYHKFWDGGKYYWMPDDCLCIFTVLSAKYHRYLWSRCKEHENVA